MRNAVLFACLLLSAVAILLWDVGHALDLGLAIEGLFGGGNVPGASTEAQIALDVRLPRILAGLLVGAALSSCGVLMQAAFHNPLASPFTLGTSSGAALGTIFAMYLLNGDATIVQLGSAAFLGALVISLPTMVVALRRSVSMEAVLLTGVALSYGALAVGSAMNFISSEATVNRFVRWTLGSLLVTRWEEVVMLAGAAVLPLFLCIRWRGRLDAMLSGEEWALARGVETHRLRFFCILAVAVSVGISVAICGPIIFIGLMCPHMARGISGSTVSRIVLTAPLVGAFTLLLCDYLGRNHPFGQHSIPPGVMTAALGTPAFIYLLWRRFGRDRR